MAQQKKNQEEEEVRRQRWQVEHYKGKAAIQMQTQRYKEAANLYTKVSETYTKGLVHR